MTVLQLSRLELGTGTLDVESIVSPQKADLGDLEKLEDSISEFSGKFNYELSTEWSEPHSSTKMGPTGQAIATSVKDLAALSDEYKENLYTLGGPNLREYMDFLLPAAVGLFPDHKGPIRRISVIRDKEMKNRPIAVLDY